MAEQIEAVGSAADAVVVACGGGGLAAGLALGLRLKGADNPIYAAEPEHYPRLAAAFAAGRPVEIAPSGQTSCDALRVTEIGNRAFEAIRALDVRATIATDVLVWMYAERTMPRMRASTPSVNLPCARRPPAPRSIPETNS